MTGRRAAARTSRLEEWAERFPAHQAKVERMRLVAGYAPRRAHRRPLTRQAAK